MLVTCTPIFCPFCEKLGKKPEILALKYDERKFINSDPRPHAHVVKEHLRDELKKEYPNRRIKITGDKLPDVEAIPHLHMDGIVYGDSGKPEALCDLYVSNEPPNHLWDYAKKKGCEVVFFGSYSLNKLIYWHLDDEEKFRNNWIKDVTEWSKMHKPVKIRLFLEDGNGTFLKINY